MMANQKIILKKEITRVLSAWRVNEEKLVFTNGCFDLLHIGHIHSLQEASKLGDRLIVGVNSDHSTKALKGENRPIIDQTARAEMVAALMWVDLVILFDELSPIQLIKEIKPQVYVKGGDYSLDTLPDRAQIEQYCEKIEFVNLRNVPSTSDIITKIKSL